MNKIPELFLPKDLPESAFAINDKLIKNCLVISCEEVSLDNSYLFYTDISQINRQVVLFYSKNEYIEENHIGFNYPCTVILNKECSWFRQ